MQIISLKFKDVMSNNMPIEKKDISKKTISYKTLVNPKLLCELRDKILEKIVMQKKYKDPDYSAKQLAAELNTNTRYISAVCTLMFNSNYKTFINKLRIEEAMGILKDRKFKDMNAEEIGFLVGFASRQSFYNSFSEVNGMTPRTYRTKYLNKVGQRKQKEND